MRKPLRSALVTGATGFIGSALVHRLLAENVEITCLIRSRSISRMSSFVEARQIRIIEVPSFETSVLQSKLAGISAEVIFHLASYGVQQGDRDIDQLVEGNISLVLHLLQATAHWPLRRFIHTGSCSEYGDPGRERKLISETDSVRPQSVYGAAKAGSVLCGNAFASSLSIPFVTLRMFGVFGTREAPHRLVQYLISRLQSNQPVDLTSGEQVRDYLFEDDAVAAFIAAATTSNELNSGEVYNVCSSQPRLIREMGEVTADVMGKSRELLRWGERPTRPDEPVWLVGDNRRFREATGTWRPMISLHEGIQRMVNDAPGFGKRGERC